MNHALKMAIVEDGVSEINALLSEHIDAIWEAIAESIVDHDGEKPFVYQVALGLRISPRGDSAVVSAKIGYGVKHTDETDGRLADPMQEKFEFVRTGDKEFEAKVK